MKFNLAGLKKPMPPVAPRLLKPNESLADHHAVESEVRAADAAMDDEDRALAEAIKQTPLPEIADGASPQRIKMSRLIDEDFPFDPSQLEAIEGLAANQYACMTGAAGTGKTTCLKAVVERVQSDLSAVNMAEYFKSKSDDAGDGEADDPEDDYVVPTNLIPAVALCAYTGRASQQIKRNFPADWHGNIMTIHRLLAYYPIWEDSFDEATGQLKKKMRFVPAYNESNKLPWQIIVIDEAGMLGLDLWHALLAACRPTTRIIMVGDINQLQPTHGKSIFGYAMAKWPSWELTKIHRQRGAENSIVDAAWSIINGKHPQSDDYRTDPKWKFAMMEIDANPARASRQLRAWLEKARGPIYDPMRDAVITPINAYKETAGWQLGQDPLNRELAVKFNSTDDRFVIDAGRDRKYFAVGDKVMATKNDHQIGITNGMTGIITDIVRNDGYAGNAARFGKLQEVQDYINGHGTDGSDATPDEDFSLEDLTAMVMEVRESSDGKKSEEANRGFASHTVIVNFSVNPDKPKYVRFQTLAEVESLMMAYVMTCHKMQGGEAPTIIIICHQAHKRMLNREWLYTAVTRTSEHCVLFYTRQGLSAAVNRQEIKGRTLAEKVESFNRLLDPKGVAALAKQAKLPAPPKDSVWPRRELGAAGQAVAPIESGEPAPAPKVIVVERIIRETVREATGVADEQEEMIDGGRLTPEPKPEPKPAPEEITTAPAPIQIARRALIPQYGAARTLVALRDSLSMAQRLLPAPAEPKPTVTPAKPVVFRPTIRLAGLKRPVNLTREEKK